MPGGQCLAHCLLYPQMYRREVNMLTAYIFARIANIAIGDTLPVLHVVLMVPTPDHSNFEINIRGGCKATHVYITSKLTPGDEWGLGPCSLGP